MSGYDHARKHTEKELLSDRLGFQGAFLAVQYLRSHIERGRDRDRTEPDKTKPDQVKPYQLRPEQTKPDTPSTATIQALLHLIRSPRFDIKKQVYFLLSEAADALILLAVSLDPPRCDEILCALQQILTRASGPRARAVGNALGKLPITFAGCPVDLPPVPSPLSISLGQLINAMGIPGSGSYQWLGRSLVVPLKNSKVGVLKFATSDDNVTALFREHFWQGQLAQITSLDQTPLNLPLPLVHGNSGLFQVEIQSENQVENQAETPLPPGHPKSLHHGICIAYTASSQYFQYPNETVTQGSWPDISQAFFTAARTLGQLTAAGLFHTALIPLFHNRVQQDRRNDQGRYLWEHGGRLDQWLDSCRFPNFALSGLRDFEHLEPAVTSKQLRHFIGEHLLSFILVMGSCFRRQDPELRGWEHLNTPVDARDLFHPQLFCEWITGVCNHYFEAFSQDPLPQELTNRIPDLVRDLVEAMGIDRDMEERLRVQDQKNMDASTYDQFLQRRGISPSPPQGESDIVLYTGPHLGGFNQSISVPGLVDFLYNFSSLCIGRYFSRQHQVNA